MAITGVQQQTSVTGAKDPQAAASLTVDLASFVALPLAQKQLYLVALDGDERFASILPRLQAVLAAETAATGGAAPTQAVNDSPKESKGPKGFGAPDIAHLLSQIHSKGFGDSDYWSKTTSNLVSTVHALAPLVAALADKETGTVQTTLRALAADLAGVRSDGYGDSKYWSDRAAKVRDVANNAGKQLRALDGVSNAEVPVKSALLHMVALAKSTSSQGFGDTEYWMKNASDMTYTAQLAGVGVSMLAKGLAEPDRTVVGNLAQRLTETSSKGFGDSSYWSSKTAAIVGEVHNLATTLERAVQAM